MATYLLVIIGAVNWGLVGLLGINLVEMIFGAWPIVVRIIYILVGVSAVYDFAMLHKEYCKICGSGKGV